MDTPQIEYAGPRTPKLAGSSWPWLDVSVALALVIGVVVFFVLGIPKSGSRPAKTEAAETDVRTLDQALTLFRRDVGRLPTDAEGLDALVTSPDEAEPWLGPYLKRGVMTDPWGNPYVYHATKPSGRRPYTLLSRGPDWVEGTADDIVNK